MKRFDAETHGVFEYDEDHFLPIMEELIEQKQACILVYKTYPNWPTGLLAFLTTPGLLNSIPTCQQLIWYVEPPFRGKMNAGLLYRRMLKIAKERGCKRLVMGLHGRNKKLSSAYRSAGMIRTETQYKTTI